MVVIPFKDFSSFIQEITLDNVPYRILFNWNTRGGYWSILFFTRDNIEIASIKLVLDFELISDYPDYGLPPGMLYVIDVTESKAVIGRNDFTNTRALQVIYVTEDEVEDTI